MGHSIHVRSPDFRFGPDIPRYWLADNVVATHMFNGMNLVFPDGERFFIAAVRDCTPSALDPTLLREIRAFNAQEGHHAREHERYFAALEAQGYDLAPFLRRFRRFTRWSTRRLPARLRLALTAGAEHYTSSFGAFAFEDEMLERAHPTMRRLLLWHAAEEIEHKHVAFDVLRASHPSLALRRFGFALSTIELFGFSMYATRQLIRQDLRAGRIDRARLRRDRRALRERQTQAARLLRERIRAYWRRDFHPGETNELPRAYERLAEVGIRVATP